MKDKTTLTSKYKISDLELELNTDVFLRIHRSFIINRSRITAFTSNEIEVNGIEIPIGASYKENVITYLEGLKNLK